MTNRLVDGIERVRRILPTRAMLCSLPVLVGVVAVVPYASLVISGDLVLKDSVYSDYGSFQVPMREFAQMEFAAGRFPHWVPWVGCGIPLHATQQVGLCYPLLTPFLFVFDANRAIKIAMLLHVVLCYVGQYRLSRSLSLTPAGAALSGLIVTQSGFLTTHLAVGHVALVLAYGLLPWFFGSIVAVCQRASAASVVQFAICVAGLLLVGHPQLPYYAFLFGGLWAIGSLGVGTAARHRVRVCGQFVLGLVVGSLIAAVQLVPTIELLGDNAGLTARGSVAYAGTYALDGLDLYRLLVPSLRGNPLVGIPEFQPPDFYHEKVCYLGLLTWWLVLTALLNSTRCRWPRATAVLVVLGMMISLGNSTVCFEIIGTIIPGLSLFRCPGRCLAVVSIVVALLAGRGFDALRSDENSESPLSRFSLWSLAIVFVLADCVVVLVVDRALAGFDWTRWGEFALHHLQPEMQASGFSLVCVFGFGWCQHRLPERSRCVLATLILTTDLGFFNLRGILYEPDDRPPLPPSVVLGSEQFRFVDAPRYPDFSSDEVRYSRYVSQAVRSRVRMIGTNEGGFLPVGCERVYRALERNATEALRLASCRDVTTRPIGEKWTGVARPFPRMRFVPHVNAADMVLPLEEVRATEGLAMAQAREDAAVEVLIDEPQHLLVAVQASSEGIFVVADTFYPGWACTIDGTLADIIRLFGCFRGVRMSPGSHVVRMQFRSGSFHVGGGLSALGTLSLLALVWVARTNRFQHRPFADQERSIPCHP